MAEAASQPKFSMSGSGDLVMYHCICSHVVFCSTTPLATSPRRTADNAILCHLTEHPTKDGHYARLFDVLHAPQASIVRREDGFDKIYLRQCPYCEVAVGYHLDESHFEETQNSTGKRADVIFIFPGGLMTTEEMEKGQDMEAEIGKITAKAVTA